VKLIFWNSSDWRLQLWRLHNRKWNIQFTNFKKSI